MERTWQFDYLKPIWPQTGNRFPIEQYPYRLSLRRKNRSGAGPYWCPVWREWGRLQEGAESYAKTLASDILR